MSESIKNKTLFALKWVTILQAVTTLGQLLIRFILANILFPDEIGLIAIITVITELLVMAADMGFNASVIQRKTIENKHVSTAFYLNMAFAAVLTLLVFFTAGPVSAFYADVRLEELLKIISVIILIRASVSVQVGLLDRELNFKKIVIISLIALVISSVVKIILAKSGYGAKSIALGDILNQVLIAGFLWITTTWKPKLKEVSMKTFRELFSFGGNVMLVNTINHLSSKADLMFIGKLAGTFATGLFSVAAMVSDMLVSVINSIVQRVLFPSFSRIQDDPERIQVGYLQATKFISLMGIPICVGIFFLSNEIVTLFLQESYQPAILLIQILSFRAIFNSMGGVLWGQVLKAKGRSRLVLTLTIVKLVALFAFIMAGSPFGLIGIAISTVAYGAVFRFVYQHVINKVINISMWKYIQCLVPSLASSLIMAAALTALRFGLTFIDLNGFIVIALVAIVGLLSYASAFMLIFRSDFAEMKKLIFKK